VYTKVSKGEISPKGKRLEKQKLDLALKNYVAGQVEGAEGKKLVKRVEEDLGKAASTLRKLIPQGEKDALFEKLEHKLLASGMSPEKFAKLLEDVKKSPPEKEAMVKISTSKLKELSRKAEEFDKEVERRVKLTTQELKKANKRLVDEKERVDNVIREMAEGLIVVDKQGKVMLVNPAAKQLLGMREEEKVNGKLLEQLRKGTMAAMTKGSLEDKEEVSKEVVLSSPDESTQKVLKASSAVVENESGKTVGMVSVLTDITKERELDELKDEFVSNISHELRSPLYTVKKSLELLLGGKSGQVTEEQEKFLSIAQRNIGQLGGLIDNLLDISKLEAGKVELKVTSLDLNELIEKVVKNFSAWAIDRKIELEYSPPGGKLLVSADEEKVMQVLNNLISNALKYTKESGKVRVGAKEVDDKEVGSGIEVSVSDTGIGVKEEDQDKIFDKFQQVSFSSPQGVSSSGLGLAISREIVQLHNGRIWVDSKIGEGSTFTFVLPKKVEQK